MKRTKFIAGALVLSMGLLGTGYAYWTDNLFITTSVKTGTMDVDFNKASANKGNTADVSNVTVSTLTDTNPVGSEYDAITDNQIVFALNNLHPTSNRYDATLEFGAISRGSIPVKIDGEIVVQVQGVVSDQIKFSINDKEYTMDTPDNIDLFEDAITSELMGDKTTWNQGDKGDVTIGVKVEGDNASQGVSGNFTIFIPWIQSVGDYID